MEQAQTLMQKAWAADERFREASEVLKQGESQLEQAMNLKKEIQTIAEGFKQQAPPTTQSHPSTEKDGQTIRFLNPTQEEEDDYYDPNSIWADEEERTTLMTDNNGIEPNQLQEMIVKAVLESQQQLQQQQLETQVNAQVTNMNIADPLAQEEAKAVMHLNVYKGMTLDQAAQRTAARFASTEAKTEATTEAGTDPGTVAQTTAPADTTQAVQREKKSIADVSQQEIQNFVQQQIAEQQG